MELPGDITARGYWSTSDSDRSEETDEIEVTAYFWAPWTEPVIDGSEDLVEPGAVGITHEFLSSVFEHRTCTGFEILIEKYLGGRHITADGELRGWTNELRAREKLRRRRSSSFLLTEQASVEGSQASKAVRPSVRAAILRGDNNRCVTCGCDASEDRLELEHIVPRALIRQLGLGEHLHSIPYNLTTLCSKCNKGKSGTLAPGDVNFHLDRCADPEHPNHALSPYLLAIQSLQRMK